MPNLMHNFLTFAGVSSASLGLRIEAVPNSDRPLRKLEAYNVPGRNGDIIRMQNAWENVEQTYTVWGGMNLGDAVGIGYSIAEWLFAPSGYQELTDSYDPDHFRLALFEGPFDLENRLTRQGRAEITFNCDPRRFLVSGRTPTSYSAADTLTNPTAFIAKPTVQVYGTTNTSGTVTIGGKTMSIDAIVNGMIIDGEAQNASEGTRNLNSYVSGDWPELAAGANTVAFTGGVTSVTITPNFWTL